MGIDAKIEKNSVPTLSLTEGSLGLTPSVRKLRVINNKE